ncbi:hypothetical protein T439DRAFT_349953 [Meredithblackwellia eburnea MCA 4105]
MESLPPSLRSSFSPTCLAQLANLEGTLGPVGKEALPSTSVKQGAVLVALFERPSSPGNLLVCLSTRAKHMRSHPFQTALPGGKIEPQDPTLASTAFREAWEEVAFPSQHDAMDPPTAHTLGVMTPFVSKYRIICHPVVCVTTPEVIDQLKPDPQEVDRVWEWPLSHVLSPKLVKDHSDFVGSLWDYEEEALNQTDDPWVGGSLYRHNRLRTSYTPLKGLTSEILVSVAIACYGENPDFVHLAPEQISFAEAVEVVVRQAEKGKALSASHTYGQGEMNGIRS